ncbi:hypothetical protein EVAR_40753_1 [Eumeta japonica]|uniref:Uncharacterized protein n=1 Tax=Eumeta variegata TaxID=151549 RepID=A0A4C1X7K2_EUMVA|nr:hypothetical protein EVAR_40753_1 [Eumeta japonica]
MSDSSDLAIIKNKSDYTTNVGDGDMFDAPVIHTTQLYDWKVLPGAATTKAMNQQNAGAPQAAYVRGQPVELISTTRLLAELTSPATTALRGSLNGRVAEGILSGSLAVGIADRR